MHLLRMKNAKVHKRKAPDGYYIRPLTLLETIARTPYGWRTNLPPILEPRATKP